MSFAMVAGITGGILSLIAYIPRARQIIKEGTRSSNTWLIWSLSNVLIFLSLYSLGAREILWVPLAYLAGSAVMTVLAYRYKVGDWTSLHKWLLTIAILSGVRWWFFADPVITLAFNTFIYLIVYITIIQAKVKSRKKQTWVVTWGLYFTGTLLNVLAIPEWSFAIALYPVALTIMNGIIFGITLRNYIRNIRGIITEVEPVKEEGAQLGI